MLLVTEALLIVYKAVVNPPAISTDVPVFSVSPKASEVPGSSAEPDPEPEPTVRESLRKEDFYTFVMVGKDQVSGLTDTIIIGALDNKNKKLNLVNIPRDTLVNVPWTLKKANSMLRDYKDGAEGLKKGIRDLTGFTVDSYIIVDTEAFVELVDAINGVDFDVPVDMHYDDPTQDLYIHFSKGYQHLDGQQALEVFRFRSGYWNADIGRIETQQKLLKAIAKKSLTLENFNIRAFADIFKKYVETDLDTGTIIWYGQQLMSLKEEDIVFQTIPANYYDLVNGLSYCTIYTEEWLKVVNECLNPYNRDITETHVNILTRDENGQFYATSGVIEGGANSVRDIPPASSNGTAESSPEPQQTSEPTELPEPQLPQQTLEPAESPRPSLNVAEPTEVIETNNPEAPPSPETTAGPGGSPTPEVSAGPAESPAQTVQPEASQSASSQP
jgi:LCP family protein required for cell wall assembly